jgi:D-xylose 1-dehydrogenase (NADP+, D-xylono-1,5-lactone-forming)
LQIGIVTGMSAKLRWGILGTGNIARQFAAGVQASRRGELAAVGSRSIESAQHFAAEFNIATACESYDRLIAQPMVDAVYVSLPNSLHHEWTLAALRAGKHVLCEKPLATNATQAEEMFDQAAISKRVLVEAFMYRSHPLTLAVAESVARGEIGELRLIRTSFCFCTKKIDGNVRFSSDLAGGGLMDVGCYCINFSRFFGRCEPAQVHAVGRLHSSGVDEIAAGTLLFPNNIVASFTCGLSVHADNTAYLCGSEGFIEIPIPWKPPADSSVYVMSHSTPPKMDTPSSGLAPGRQVRRVPVEGELYGIEADDFAAAVLDGQTPRLNRVDSVGNMRILDEMRRQIGVKPCAS